MQDLKNAKSLVDWVAWAEPQLDLSSIMKEWCNETPKELDFNNEAGMLISKILLYFFFNLNWRFIAHPSLCWY